MARGLRGTAAFAVAVASCLGLADAVRAQPSTLHFYVAASGAFGGDGSVANPYRRITDAVERARADRASGEILPADVIQIHVGPGTYVGSYDPVELQSHSEYEVLPIILNVSGLAMLGSTSLVRDERDLPTGSDPSSETILQPEAPLSAGQSLFLIADTTDDSLGNDVAIEGFVLDAIDGPFPEAFPHVSVMIDRVLGFRIRNNVLRHGNYALYTRLASGTIEGNLITDGHEAGGLVQGGSPAQPATIQIHANRIVGAATAQHGIMAGVIANDLSPDSGTNSVGLEPLQSTFDRNDPEDLENIHDTLAVALTDNDISGYRIFGVRFMTVLPHGNLPECTAGIGYGTLDATQALTAALNADVTGNTLGGPGFFGVGFEAGFPCRDDPRSIVAAFAGSFEGNAFAGNSRGPALFSFINWGIAFGFDTLQGWKYQDHSTYQLTDADGELAGSAYDHPVADPINGAQLDNTISLNGRVLPHARTNGLPACNDQIDNDFDGTIDRADRGCPLFFPNASPEDPQCDDGLDNDGNGLVDFADPKCSRSWPYWEKAPACGLGVELALVMPSLLWLRRRRGRSDPTTAR